MLRLGEVREDEQCILRVFSVPRIHDISKPLVPPKTSLGTELAIRLEHDACSPCLWAGLSEPRTRTQSSTVVVLRPTTIGSVTPRATDDHALDIRQHTLLLRPLSPSGLGVAVELHSLSVSLLLADMGESTVWRHYVDDGIGKIFTQRIRPWLLARLDPLESQVDDAGDKVAALDLRLRIRVVNLSNTAALCFD